MIIPNIIKTHSGYKTEGVLFTPLNYSGNIGVGFPVALTIPEAQAVGQVAGYVAGRRRYFAIFDFRNMMSGNEATVWVAYNDIASAPGAGLDPTASQQNPGGREVIAGDVLSFITLEADVSVGVSLYTINS